MEGFPPKEIITKLLPIPPIIENPPYPFIEEPSVIEIPSPPFVDEPIIDGFPSEWIPQIVSQIGITEIPGVDIAEPPIAHIYPHPIVEKQPDIVALPPVSDEEQVIDGFPPEWIPLINTIDILKEGIQEPPAIVTPSFPFTEKPIIDSFPVDWNSQIIAISDPSVEDSVDGLLPEQSSQDINEVFESYMNELPSDAHIAGFV